jgi:large subunit ribosomal protein L22
MPEATATARYVRVSPRKARRIIDLIRGRSLKEARAILRLTPSPTARMVLKVLNSAAANAEANHDMEQEFLRVARCYVDGGPSMRRMRIGSMGRGGVIRHRMSHITVVVEEQEELREAAREAARRRRRRAPAAKPKAAAAAKREAKPKRKAEEQAIVEEPAAAEAGAESVEPAAADGAAESAEPTAAGEGVESTEAEAPGNEGEKA